MTPKNVRLTNLFASHRAPLRCEGALHWVPVLGRALVLVALSTIAVACSSDGGTASGGGGSGGGGSGGTGGSSSGGVGGLTTSCTGDGDCGAGQFCSASGTCVADGSCGGDGDCTAPQTCGAASRACLDPGSCLAEGDCVAGQTCDTANGTCGVGGGCGQSEFQLERLQPNMMILLDRSGSMEGDSGGDSRWNVAKGAIQTVTQAFDAEIRFGLATYSSCLPGGCSAGSVVVPIADNNAVAVNGFLADKIDQGSSNGMGTGGGGIRYLCDSGDPETSTGKSLHALTAEASLQDPVRDNTVLLITDGAETSQCVVGGQDALSGATALSALGIRTYVVGLNHNTAVLDQVAMAGGTGMLIPANNSAELTAALSNIASQVVTCEFGLDTAPPGVDQLFVFFDDDPGGVPQDAANGWSYDPGTNKITFNGSSCDQIKSGAVSDIDVVFGCPQPVPE